MNQWPNKRDTWSEVLIKAASVLVELGAQYGGMQSPTWKLFEKLDYLLSTDVENAVCEQKRKNFYV